MSHNRSAARSAPDAVIKPSGYVRRHGDGAVIDHQFGTTDVLVVMPVAAIASRYVGHFGADAGRHAA